MDTTIRNLDETTYRRLKARAALTGKTVGEAFNEAAAAYLALPEPGSGRTSLLDLPCEPGAVGDERLSEQVDAVVYGD